MADRFEDATQRAVDGAYVLGLIHGVVLGGFVALVAFAWRIFG